MLELKKITKVYPAGDGKVEALNEVSLQFRKSEFVSILGPSGCGKTTMLNVIGGLDQYTDGDLLINGKSTKDFNAREWDTYRNHSIGFVFQSYNLIPHQTVLQNVELALTLSGVSKGERRKRAKKALEEVGLGSQLNKKPNQMSGGQMQRVAIARALVNQPDIILADEPTGALDTETSVQVMEILKEISRDRLVIMVTHNPDLAQRYSSRIVRMLDGRIIDDSKPLAEEEYQRELTEAREKAAEERKKKKPSMKLTTAFMLSMKNLFTKKGRTMLTAFAGSIGIIGIALIFALSQGMTTFINTVQEDTLSSYPLTLEATSIDVTSLLSAFMDVVKNDTEHDRDAVYKKSAVYDIFSALNRTTTTENDLKAFKEYLEAELAKENGETDFSDAVNGVQYSYDLDLQVYTKSVDGTIIRSDTKALLQELLSEYLGADLASLTSASSMSSLADMGDSSMMGGGMSMNLWQEMLAGKNGEPVNDLLKKQYDLVYGTWPNSEDEIVLVLDRNNELDDMTLYALGLESKETMNTITDAALKGGELAYKEEQWSYEDICGMEFRVVLSSDCYSYDKENGIYTDLRSTETGMRYLYDHGIPLRVTGIIRPNADAQAAMLTGSIAYTSGLTKAIIERAYQADVVKAQLENPATDVLTGLPFEATTGTLSAEEKEAAFREYINGLDEAGRAEAYISIMGIPDDATLQGLLMQTMQQYTRADMEMAMIQSSAQQMGIDEETAGAYIAGMSDEEITELFSRGVTEQLKVQYAAQVKEQLSAMSTAELSGALAYAMPTYTAQQCAAYYDQVITFSDSTYEDNLTAIGYVDMESPKTINIYASSFENKEKIEDTIAAYNDTVDELSRIRYTDYVGLMMSSVVTIIDTITYVLVAFVAISLIVSSIMIGVITLISVQERTKEIGILRAIGASKHDVSSMFNAETVMIGFAAGLLGVLVTYLLCIPINLIIHRLTGIASLNAILPLPVAVILVAISVLLTLIAGIIPSRSAAKKDPVVALRTE